MSLPLQSAFEQWLRSAQGGLVDAEQLWDAAGRAGSPFASVVKTFALDATEERLLAALWAAHAGGEALSVATLARVLGTTAAVAESRLGPKDKLVRHALVEIAGPLSGRATVELGRGLGGRLAGAAYEWAEGTTIIPSPSEDASGAQRFADRFAVGPRLHEPLRLFVGTETRLAMISAASARDAFALGAAIGKKLNRRTVVVDGWDVSARSDRRAMLRALRRDAELDGFILALTAAHEVRDAWGVLCEPLAAAATKPLCVLVCDEREHPFVAMPPGDPYPRLLEVRLLGKSEQIAAPAAAAAGPTGLGELQPKPDPFAPYRQQAALDAERAMGASAHDVRLAASQAMRMPAPQKTAMPPAPPAALAPPVEVVPPPVDAVPPPVVVAPPPVPPAPAPAVAAPAPDMAAPSAPPVASVSHPEAQLEPQAEEKKAKKGKKGKKTEKADKPAEPVTAAAPLPPEPVAPAPELPPPPPAPPVEIPKGATPKMLAQIAMTSPNPEQRIELISTLAEIKDPMIIAAIRANTKSEHAGVRAAAEIVMQRHFGPNWNQQRAIPKPVQPPRSDDDRGPPGGY